jgi:hypothetical protein
MTREPLHPLDIPEDTTHTGLAGWITESLARSLMLRFAALLAIGGGTLGLVADLAPALTRASAAVCGATLALSLFVSQVNGWPRSRQWALILATTVLCGSLVVFHFIYGR